MMLKQLVIVYVAVLPFVAVGEEFHLKHEKTGEVYGPFSTTDGSKVVLGTDEFTVFQKTKPSALDDASSSPDQEDREIITKALRKIRKPENNSEESLRRYARDLLSYNPYSQSGTDDIGAQERKLLLVNMGEENLGLILQEALRTNDRVAIHAANEAAQILASQQNKADVLRALEKEYRFATVVLEKGWAEDAEDALVKLLRNIEPWSGYGRGEIDFVALCAKAESEDVWKGLEAFCHHERCSINPGVLMNVKSRVRRYGVPQENIDKIYRFRWEALKTRPINSSTVAFALPAANAGDLDALGVLGSYLAVSPEGASSNYIVKQAYDTVLERTEAPHGSNREVGLWVRRNKNSLKWDAQQDAFVTR